MADPTTRSVPKDQPKGAAQEQESFEAEGEALTAAPFEPMAAAPLPPLVEPEPDDDDEEDLPNLLGLGQDEVDLNELLFRPSDRPDEDVTFGIPGMVAGRQQRMSDVIRGVLDRGMVTPDLEALLQLTENLDI